MSGFWLQDCCAAGGHLEWGVPSGLRAALVTGAALLWIWGMRPWRPARWAEGVGLAAALAALAWAACGPAWVQDGERVEPGRLIVLVDGSRSMDVRESDGQPRSAAVAGLLDRIGPAEVYTFGDSLRSGAPSAYTDGDSDLGGALDAIGRRYAGERLGGLVVVSDGIERGGLRSRVKAGAALPTLAGPLTVYAVGSGQGRSDLAVDDIRAGSFAFLRAAFPIDVDVRAVGPLPAEVTVTLTRDGQPAGTAVARIGPDGRGTAHFRITPDRPGRFLYEASVPLAPSDAVPANQQLGRVVRVVRDRVRVLQVCGSPSWDQKFLRLFLKEDPSVDLVSFFILRTERDMNSGYSPDELSLIEFPYKNLFDQELNSFDLVIFQNFDYRPYFESRANELLGNVAAYVKAGGAFVMLGGDRSFDLGEYAGTPIADILPVRLGVEGAAVDEAPVVPVLTAAGARHPITRIGGESDDPAAAWAALGSVDGVNLVAGAAPGAAVLLQHPALRTREGAPMPILAVSEVGKGRSMALMSDASWRWSFGGAGAGRGNEAYLRFWKGAMRWLIGDAADAPVTVETARENYAPGESATAVVRVRDVAYAPVAGASVEARVSGPEGESALQAVTDADGVARVELPTGQRGAHRVRVRAGESAVETVYGVTSRDPELDEVEPDPGFLQALAASSGGRFVPSGAWDAPIQDPTAGRHVRDRRVVALGMLPPVGVIWALGASVAWLLRRRAGLR